MTKSKSLLFLIIYFSLFAFSCGSKEQKQEYVDDKPVTSRNIDSLNNNSSEQKKVDVKTDTLNSKTSLTDNSKDKDYKTYTKTYNPVAVVSPLEAGDYMGKEITVKGFVADVYKSEKVAYLNFVEKFPQNPFTAVIFASRFASFGNIEKYERKNVEVTGRVSKYKDKPQIILDGENRDKDAAYIEGPNGKVFKGFKSTIPDIEKLINSLPDPEPQIGTFSESVKTRKKFALNESNGHRSCSVVNLGIIALRLGRNLKYDTIKQEFIDDEGANKLINQPMRGPWKI